jgi:hypothetical protein
VLTDETRIVRWTGPLFAVFSLILLPWTIYIAGSLPSRQVSTNNDAAWAGFDVLLMLTLARAGGGDLARPGRPAAVGAGRLPRADHPVEGPSALSLDALTVRGNLTSW